MTCVMGLPVFVHASGEITVILYTLYIFLAAIQ